MLFGRITENLPPQITFNTGAIDRVTSFKLLGLIISDNLSWENHANAVCAKAGTHLHFLKLLKRSLVTFDNLIYTLLQFIRPVIVYACPVWQSVLTIDRRGRLESIQRRALHIIFGSLDYELNCALCDIETISTRLDNSTRSF